MVLDFRIVCDKMLFISFGKRTIITQYYKKKKNMYSQQQVDAAYHVTRKLIADEFLANSKKPLFNVEVSSIFPLFVSGIPQAYQQQYTCNTCKNFFNKFGNVVYIENGEIKSALFGNTDEVPEIFRKSVEICKYVVEHCSINNVFYSSKSTFGEESLGGWSHFYAKMDKSKIHRNLVKTASQLQAEKSEDFKMLEKALNDWSWETVNKVKELVASNTFYRMDTVSGVSNWFWELKKKYDKLKNQHNRKILIWEAVANAPIGFCHINSSMIGTLLSDMQSGYSIAVIKTRF